MNFCRDITCNCLNLSKCAVDRTDIYACHARYFGIGVIRKRWNSASRCAVVLADHIDGCALRRSYCGCGHRSQFGNSVNIRSITGAAAKCRNHLSQIAFGHSGNAEQCKIGNGQRRRCTYPRRLRNDTRYRCCDCCQLRVGVYPTCGFAIENVVHQTHFGRRVNRA